MPELPHQHSAPEVEPEKVPERAPERDVRWEGGEAANSRTSCSGGSRQRGSMRRSTSSVQFQVNVEEMTYPAEEIPERVFMRAEEKRVSLPSELQEVVEAEEDLQSSGSRKRTSVTNERRHSSRRDSAKFDREFDREEVIQLEVEVLELKRRYIELEEKHEAAMTELSEYKSRMGHQEQLRHLQVNSEDEECRSSRTAVVVDRYAGPFSFLILSLWDKFHCLTNIWFLFISCVQVRFAGSAETAIPLTVMLLLQICKEGYEGWCRSQHETALNRIEVNVVDLKRPILNAMSAQELEPGMCIRLKAGDVLPADAVLISSDSQDGVAYVNTFVLDGCTSLVRRVAIEETRHLRSLPDISQLRGSITCTAPSPVLGEFSGFFRCEGHTRLLNLKEEQLMLRGTTLKNTSWAFGIVVYRGADTKLAQNTVTKRLRRTGATHTLLNTAVMPLIMLVVLLLMAAGAFYHAGIELLPPGARCNEHQLKLSGLGACFVTHESITDTLLANLDLLQHAVPISLFLVLEFARLFQVWMVPRAVPGAVVNSAALVPDLGQLEFCFVETTGTVTATTPKFTMCAVGSKRYGAAAFDTLMSLLTPHDVEKLQTLLGEDLERTETNSISSLQDVSGAVNLEALANNRETSLARLFASDDGRKQVYQRLVSNGKCYQDGLGCLVNTVTGQRILRSRELQSPGNMHPRAHVSSDIVEAGNRDSAFTKHASRRSGADQRGSSQRVSHATNGGRNTVASQPGCFLDPQASRLSATSLEKTDLQEADRHSIIPAIKYNPNATMVHTRYLRMLQNLLGDVQESVRDIASDVLQEFVNGSLKCGASDVKDHCEFEMEHRSFGAYDIRQLICHLFRWNSRLLPGAIEPPQWTVLTETNGEDGGTDILADPTASFASSVYLTNGFYIKPTPHCSFRDESLIHDLLADCTMDDGEWTPSMGEQSRLLEDLVRCALVCHRAEPSRVKKPTDTFASEYESTMPEEAALLSALSCCGFTLLDQRPDHVWVKIEERLGNDGSILRLRGSADIEAGTEAQSKHPVRWDVLSRSIDGDARRRCMSVLVGDIEEPGSRSSTPDPDDEDEDTFGPATLYVKGTETALLTRLDPGIAKIQDVKRALADFHDEGARCLILAKRSLDADEVEEYLTRFNEAKASLTERERLLKNLGDEVERDLEPIGVVAFEDRLQKGAVDALHGLLDAGIRVCIVANDGPDEALAMAHNMNLIAPMAPILRILDLPQEPARASQRLAMIHAQFAQATATVEGDSATTNQHLHEPADNGTKTVPRVAVILDGNSLSRIVIDTQLRVVFLRIAASKQVTLLAVHLSPLMKGKLVELFRSSVCSQATPDAPCSRPLCVAVGCSRTMLHAADIGVAVVGSNVSVVGNATTGPFADFAVERFCDLQPLFLSVGRTACQRTSFLILFSFFKAFALLAAGTAHAVSTGAAAEQLFPSPLMPLYQALASLLALPMALFDEDLPTFIALTFPFLYVPGQARAGLNSRALASACLHGLVRGFVAFLACFFGLYCEAPVVLGCAVYACLLTYCAARIGAVDARRRHPLVVAVALVFCFGIAVTAVAAALTDFTSINTTMVASSAHLAVSPRFWLVAALGIFANLALDCATTGKQRWLPLAATKSWDGIVRTWFSRASGQLAELFTRVILAPRAVEEHMSPKWRVHLGLILMEVPVFFKSLSRVRVRSGGGIALINAGGGGLEDMADTLMDWMPSMGSAGIRDKNSLVNTFVKAIRPWTLQFKKSSHEVNFLQGFFAFQVGRRLRLWCLCLLAGGLITTVHEWPFGGERVLLAPLLALTLLAILASYCSVFYSKYVYVASVLWLGLVAWALVWAHKVGGAMELAALAPMFVFVFLPLPFRIACAACTGQVLLLVLVFVVGKGDRIADVSTVEARLLPAHASRLAVITLLTVAQGYHLEYGMRRQFLLEFAAAQGHQSTRSVLYNMLPQFVADGLLWGLHFSDFTKALDDISIIFCKVDHFADWVGDIQAGDLVSVLDRMFAAFDQACERQEVMKVETASEVYFAASGINQEGCVKWKAEEAALKAIEAGIDMICIATRVCVTIDKTNARSQKSKALVASSRDGTLRKPMDVKVGVHSGRVICGVVGSRKPQFSLYGDTVNTASRMAHTCPCGGSVQVSEEVHELMEDDARFKWEERTVKVKGKGKMKTFLLEEGKGILLREKDELGSRRADNRKTSFVDGMSNRKNRSHSTAASAAAAAVAACAFAEKRVSKPTPPVEEGEQPVSPPGMPPPTLRRDSQGQNEGDHSTSGERCSQRRHSRRGMMPITPGEMTTQRRPSRTLRPSEVPVVEQLSTGTASSSNSTLTLQVGNSPLGPCSPAGSRRGSVISVQSDNGACGGGDGVEGRNNLTESSTRARRAMPALGTLAPVSRPVMTRCASSRCSREQSLQGMTSEQSGDAVAKRSSLARSPSEPTLENQRSISLSSIRSVVEAPTYMASVASELAGRLFFSSGDRNSSSGPVVAGPGGTVSKPGDLVNKRRASGVQPVLDQEAQSSRTNVRRPSKIGANLMEMASTSMPRSSLKSLFASEKESRWDNQEEGARNPGVLAAQSAEVLRQVSLTFREDALEQSFETHHFLASSVGRTRQLTVVTWAVGNLCATLLAWMVPLAAGEEAQEESTTRLDSVLTFAWVAVGCALVGLARLRRVGGRFAIFALDGLTEAQLTAFAGMGGALLSLAEPVFVGVGGGVRTKAILGIVMWLAVMNAASELMLKQLLPLNLYLFCAALALILIPVKSDLTSAQALDLVGLLVLFSLLGLAAARVKELWLRTTFVAHRDVRQTELRAKRLMEEMMPVQIRKRLSDSSQLTNDHRIADEYHRMVLLFSDIAGFTAYSKTVEPEKVVAMLSQLFVRYDQWTSQLEIYKLYTIGDAYVCLTEPEVTVSDKDVTEGAERMLQMAQLMHSHLKATAKSLHIPGLSMRIGLHLGHFVGGVIGSSKLRFDLFGLDVLTAANMESNGVPGEICVSEQLKDVLEKAFPERFGFRFNCAVEVMDRTTLSYLVTDSNARTQPT